MDVKWDIIRRLPTDGLMGGKPWTGLAGKHR
jgi:hypothetical protein